MTNRKFIVNIPEFDEARPVAEIVQTASQFSSEIFLISGNKKINAKSIMGMMSLVLKTGDTITVTADGTDESKALDGIEDYLTGGK